MKLYKFHAGINL